MLRGLLSLLLHIILVGFYAFPAMLWTKVRPGSKALDRAFTAWGSAQFPGAGVKLVVENGEVLERCRPAVIVANHCSHFDIYAVAKGLPPPVVFAAKASLFRIPILRWVMFGMGMRPLERTGTAKDIQNVAVMSRSFARRAVLVFFAEGTRSLDGRIRPFKKGAIVAALREGVPIVPVAISGSHRVQPADTWKIRPGTITLRILEPVPTEGCSLEHRDAITRRVYDAIVAALPEDQRPV